jgi:phospholipid/cholesterol/gamma-HCH transport system ATP-binding protein
MDPEHKEPVLQVQGLAVGYGDQDVQHDVSFDVKRGSIFAIMGPSGCGKSTLLKALIGLLRPAPARCVTVPGITGHWSRDSETTSAAASASCSRVARCGVR